jgi:hypothetical protein
MIQIPRRFKHIQALERRFKYLQNLENRLAEEAARLIQEAKSLPHSAVRDQMIRKARQADIGSRINEWRHPPATPTELDR